MAWERELSVFMRVVAIFLVFSPYNSMPTALLYELIFLSTSPSTKTPFLASSLIWWILLSGQSWIIVNLRGHIFAHCKFPYMSKLPFVSLLIYCLSNRKTILAILEEFLCSHSKYLRSTRWDCPVLSMFCPHRSVHTRRCSRCIPKLESGTSRHCWTHCCPIMR
jgi:hypothetical protein